MVGIAAYEYRRQQARKRAELAKLEARKRSIGAAISEAIEVAAPVPTSGERELTADDLAALRYGFDRALQPVGQLNGYDKVDQFQTSALRYQINHLGYGLGMLQCMYTPSFHGYLSQAQRNLIELYLDKRIWGYWLWESAWGHLNVTDPDPAAKDNIMLTGWLGIQLCMYMSNTGDRRYAEPGSLPFRRNQPSRVQSRRAYHRAVGDEEFSRLGVLPLSLRAQLGLSDLQSLRHDVAGDLRSRVRLQIRSGRSSIDGSITSIPSSPTTAAA